MLIWTASLQSNCASVRLMCGLMFDYVCGLMLGAGLPKHSRAGRGQVGPHLTSATPEAAPGAVFARDSAATLQSEQLPQWSLRLHSSVASCRSPFKSGENSDSNQEPLDASELSGCLRRPALGSARILELRERL